MDNQSYEQEIDLKDLMFAVFHKWRGIIITAVILGLLLGGYKLAAGLGSKEDVEAVQQAQEDYNESLEMYERTLKLYELELETIQTKMEMQEDYLSNSILMRISPYHKNVASADIFVRVDSQSDLGEEKILTSDPADSILRAYKSVLSSIELEGALEAHLEELYLKELVTTAVDYEGNVLTIQVAYTDQQGAELLLEELLKGVQSRFPELQREFGNHESIIMNERTSIVTDPGLFDSQQRASNMLATLQKAFTDKKAASDEMKEPAVPSGVSSAASLKSGIKYGVLGGVLGAFLSVFCICVIFLMSDKLSSEKELKNRFGLKILGVFAQTPKKRALSGVDRWLDRLEGKSSKRPEEVYEIMAANVRNYMEEGRDIMMLGSVSKDRAAEIAEELRKRIDGVEIQVGQDMGTSAETLRLLPEAGQIILVEERGVSKYEEIQNQVEVVRSLDKSIVGCIVI